jgi:hypothetical protein
MSTENKKAAFYKPALGSIKIEKIVSKLLCWMLFSFFPGLGVAQKGVPPSNDTTFIEVDTYFNFLESLKALNRSLSVTSYALHILDGKIGGGVTFVLKSGRPFSSSGRIGIGDVNIDKCDSTVIKKIYGYKINMSFLTQDCCVPCYFLFQGLEKQETELLTSIVGDTLSTEVINEYIGLMPFWEILNRKFDFYDDSKIAPSFYNPRLIVMKKLFLSGKFDVMKKLMFTKNRVFNWFVAEALVFFNKSVPFLNSKEVRTINQFNGRNRYTKFRKYETLEHLYTK